MSSSSSRSLPASLRLTASCFVLSFLFLGGCAQTGTWERSVSHSSSISTPEAEAQKKNDIYVRSSRAGETPGRWLPSQSAYPTPAQMAARMNEKLVVPSVTKVAVLAPLSGKAASLGQEMVNAAQLAVFDIGGDSFELIPRDTKGTPDGAILAMRDAIGSGASLIIGPLFAADVAAIKPIVKENKINTLALSTDVSLAEPGIYVMGFAPVPQVRRVISYAIGKGKLRFAALTPEGPYGALVSEAFTESVKNRGGDLVFSGSKDKLAALLAVKDDIDALFLPFAGAELAEIAGVLQAGGLDQNKVKLLGTGLWDEPTLGQTQPFLLGGWYAASDPKARVRFIKTYKDSFGHEPPRLATLAYDATALAAVLVRQHVPLDHDHLTSPSGFAGLDGIFRLDDQGQIERGLAINEISAAGGYVIDPSPKSFMQ